MATSTTKRSLCKACDKAPSVFFCQGCEKGFCTPHAKEHRQQLSKQLDTIIVKHDQLKQSLAERMKKSSDLSLIKEIDQWEKESIEKIVKAAEDARKQLSYATSSYTAKLSADLKQLTQELTVARSEDNYIEHDLTEWMKQLQQWMKDLNTPSTMSIQYEKSVIPFIEKIIVGAKKNGFFAQVAGALTIEDNGQVILSLQNGYSTVRCQGEYSLGQHTCRFKIEQKHSSSWMLFGIVSKDTPLQAIAHNLPTTFAWISNSWVILNGSGISEYSGYKSDLAHNDIVELFLDCDRRIIRLTNERTNSKHELRVNVDQCPFPWQLSIGLHDVNDRIRYLPSQ